MNLGWLNPPDSACLARAHETGLIANDPLATANPFDRLLIHSPPASLICLSPNSSLTKLLPDEVMEA